jgi:transcription antitermination factor NusG
MKTVELPLFPGYVFCHITPEQRLPLLTIPGVVGFVSENGAPVPLRDSDVAAIRAVLQAESGTKMGLSTLGRNRLALPWGPLADAEEVEVG